jgi:hypothetical protein
MKEDLHSQWRLTNLAGNLTALNTQDRLTIEISRDNVPANFISVMTLSLRFSHGVTHDSLLAIYQLTARLSMLLTRAKGKTTSQKK